MILFAGYYNRQESLKVGTVVKAGTAGSYGLIEAAVIESSDCPRRKLLDL
jgi:hypothetical protein